MTKTAILAAGLAAVMCSAGARAGGDEGSGNTTVVRNGNSVAVITQSGDPAKAEVHVEKEPGRTFVYRRSGGSTTVVTQSTSPADIPPESMPPWLRDLLRR